MPHDLTLSIKGVKTKDVKYTLVAARQNTPLTADELAAVAEAGSIRDIQRDFQLAAAERETSGSAEPIITADPVPITDRYATVPEEFRPKKAAGA